jgi:uncharacterized membrane protein YccC
MSEAARLAGALSLRANASLRAAGPPLLFGVRLWASVCLALYIAFWLQLDNAFWAGTSAAIVCQPQLGASLRKGWFRMIGTVIGAIAIVLLTACFPQDRGFFFGLLAVWGAACALMATLLANFASYAAALAGYTAAIVASDQLGATGGPNGDAFMLAVARATEICIGILSAGVVLAGTDLGGAPRRLAAVFADMATGIMAGFAATLARAGGELGDTQAVRRDFIRRVMALDPVIDQTLGESSRIRYHSSVLQAAVNGLLSALAGWRAVANHLVRLPRDEARQAAAVILKTLPQELVSERARPERWIAAPIGLYRTCETAARALIALPADRPSLRLLADKTAEALYGMSHALNGLALLMADPARPVQRRPGIFRLAVPDWLPALVNAGRAFVTIGAVTLFWIVTGWPNGASAITFAAVGVLLFAPRADLAYSITVLFMAGTALSAVFAAIVAFAVLPRFESFLGFAIAIGLVLVPAGAGIAQPWLNAMFTAIAANFVPLLGPANQMSYDTVQFYNAAVAIVAGIGAAVLSFRLLPPLSPAYRARRLLALTLQDLRRIAMGRTRDDWASHVHGRLSAMPEEAAPLQRAQLLAALSVGSEIAKLRDLMRKLDLGSGLDAAFAAVAEGSSARAITHLGQVDAALAARSAAAPAMQEPMRARASVLALSEVLDRHAAYFDAGASR